MGKEIIFAGKACDKCQPRIGQVKVDALTYRWAQQRVSAFIEHTAVVYDNRAQHIIGRTSDTLTVTQLRPQLAFSPSNREVGEPVVIGATGLRLPDAKRTVISRNVLIAQSCIQAPLAQQHLVFGKTGNILFFHLVVGLWYDVLLVEVVAVALCGCNLRTATQLTFPDRISQYQLACCHRVFLRIDGGDGAVAKFLTILLLFESVLRFASQQGGVQVDAQFPHLSYIVSIQFPYRFIKSLVIRFQKDVAIKAPVFLIVLIHFSLHVLKKTLL